MTTLQQILLGTGLLAFSVIIHVTVIALSIPYLAKIGAVLPKDRLPRLRYIVFFLLTIFIVVFAHTIEVWTWAAAFLLMTELPNFSTSFYFATVTYTTLGYGDIVLDAGARIVATFCAVTGLLTFGISTAFLIGVLSRILPDIFADTDHDTQHD
ncbi:MAG: potassium channel family protein [Pseudomonadota bacterium]